jgi:hypothetical protein
VLDNCSATSKHCARNVHRLPLPVAHLSCVPLKPSPQKPLRSSPSRAGGASLSEFRSLLVRNMQRECYIRIQEY